MHFVPARCLSAACLSLLVVTSLDAQDALTAVTDPPTWIAPKEDQAILKALDEHAKYTFLDQPLSDVVASISHEMGVDVVLDQRALEDVGMGTDTPITKAIAGITHRSFLRLLLSELDLTYHTRGGALWITTPEAAEAELLTRVYPVGDLIDISGSGDKSSYDYDSLSEVISSVVAPNTWDDVGGPGAMEGIYGTLVMSQTADVHDEVARFIEGYRGLVKAHRQQPGGGPRRILLGTPGDAPIRASLDKKITLQLVDVPLREVAEKISEIADVPVVIDTRALEDFGIGTDVPLTIRVKNSLLRHALHRILRDLELTFVIRDEVLLITTPEEAEATLILGLYPVYDLVKPDEPTDADDDLTMGSTAVYDFDTLIETIASIVAPESWDSVGGPSSIEPLETAPSLFIAQTEEIHERIGELLDKLRQAQQLERKRVAAIEPPDEQAASKPLVLEAYALLPGLSMKEVQSLLLRALGDRFGDADPDVFLQVVGNSVVIRHDAATHRRVRGVLNKIGVLLPMGHGHQLPQGSSGPPQQQPGQQQSGGLF